MAQPFYMVVVEDGVAIGQSRPSLLLPQLQPPPLSELPLFLPGHCVHLLLPVKGISRATNPLRTASWWAFSRYTQGPTVGFRGLLIREGIWAVPGMEGVGPKEWGTEPSPFQL